MGLIKVGVVMGSGSPNPIVIFCDLDATVVIVTTFSLSDVVMG